VKIKSREKLLILGAGLMIVYLAGERLIINPLIGFWKKRNDRIVQLDKDLTAGKLSIAREKTIRERWDMMRANALPASTADAEGKVLKAVDRWATASQVSLTSRKNQWKQSARDDDYTTLECRVDGTGDMQSIARFLYELEKDPLALRIEDLEVTSRDERGQLLALGVRFSGLKLNPERK
jgi:hypothetical protein